MHLMIVAGVRPDFMKIAPLTSELGKRTGVNESLVHTGQHYDRQMSQMFFEQLRIPEGDVNLTVGSGSHAVQTPEIMRRFEPVRRRVSSRRGPGRRDSGTGRPSVELSTCCSIGREFRTTDRHDHGISRTER